jgi:CTP:molybdopterin cytidylyltransferase MocA
MRTGVAAVVLAAGGSRRLGHPKQLVLWQGESLVRRAARVAVESSCGRVVVVVGAVAPEVRDALAGVPVEVVSNDDWSEGMAASIRCGVGAVAHGGEGAVLLVACDQPALTASHLDRIVARWVQGARAVGSRYAGTLGVPALFDRSFFPPLLALHGDTGAKKLLRDGETAAVDWADGSLDVDTQVDLERAAAALR